MDRPVKWALLALLLVVSPSVAQPSPPAWCTQHHPCDWASHAAGVVGGSLAIDRLTPLNVSEARWLIAAYYTQREIRGLVRFGPGLPDTNKAFELPMWLDTTLDLASVAVGVWLAPKADRSLWGNRLTFSFGPLAIP